MTKLQKILSTMFVVAMLITTGAVMAQDDDTTAPDTAFCASERGERGENPVQAAFDELGITREDVHAYIEAGGTIEEFFAENGIDNIEAIRETQEAERQATLSSCIDEAEAEGLISAEQANQLRDAIENGTLRELVESGEFDGIFPRGERDGRPQAPHGEDNREGQPRPQRGGREGHSGGHSSDGANGQ